ncbi:MAG: glycosyltransferase [Magnetococcales bacterium]|nr:glycosyltransferase [Magnetococcales bacterium]MBF0150113.1 glycosyltransferase [Magnetococcales bacterium]MBF0172845.1 glycosyltransferase [Magnetococcales bacterium]MBF0631245.1 glycosyltransferase [Magnetococcales bacterium]
MNTSNVFLPDPDEPFSIVIPTRNEAGTIADIVTRSLRLTPHVWVMDGASSDGTPQLAAQAGARVVTVPERGKGRAIRAVVDHVTTPIIVFIDADGSHVVEDIPRLLAPLRAGAADHVQASRLIGGSSELHGGFDEFLRLSGSALITALINWRFKVRLSESQNGFRAIRLDLLRSLNLKENITTIEQEMVMKTLKIGGRLAEVPSHEHQRLCGHSSIRLGRVWWRYVYVLVIGLFF